ncbi:EF-P 5-aminopentanol modification-associated protein YfmH [Lapidilactobacillus bayanensis]|uniref:EF-P 5-aminopentanol modification-associated protein YfmH n=1 Tax=Lapidilactobacillus bayanensis TaxID=2485998 RepID=UPI000F793F8C|nr:pitrilysin family protein [Lapidilactobacillus bayanensis]
MEEFSLCNGLTVQLIDKPGFKKQFAAVMVDFGGVDQQYRRNGQVQPLPAGIAHFIEHQLFNKVAGDISQQFAQNGAETNAFTSPSKTAYFFNSTGQLTANLDLLAQLVGQPYFQAESVTRERQIIAQELSLYQDQPDFQLETGLLKRLYGAWHPLAEDIAGTPESLQAIDPEVLYAAYQAYYRPTNMRLCVVADLANQQLVQYFQQESNLWCQLAAKEDFATSFTTIAAEPSQNHDQAISVPTLTNNKWSLGLISPTPAEPAARILLQLDLDLVLTTLFGETSPIFQAWRHQGLIDDSFQYQVTLERQYSHVVFTANTDDGEQLTTNIEALLKELNDKYFKNFTAVQQLMVGNSLFAEDDLGGVCLENLELGFYDCDWQTFGQLLRQRTLTESLINVATFLKSGEFRSYSLLGGQLA